MSRSVHQQEAVFHDQWAKQASPENTPVRELFEGPAAMENRFILRQMGDLTGTTLLDIGCGLGESSVYFAMRGAAVTALDISPEMIAFAHNLASHHGMHINGKVSTAETLPEPDNTYDLVYVANTLHHVTDKPRLLAEIARGLKPGGRFFAIDPLCYNPVINMYRRMATEVRTPNERPLSFADITLARRYFAEVGHREFWLTSLSLFLKYYLIDRIHPNQQRYWKRIFTETQSSLRWWLPLRSLDEALTRVPGLRRLAWNMVLWGRKPNPN